MLNKFYGGVLPQPIKRYANYPLNNAIITDIIGDNFKMSGSSVNELDTLSDFVKTLTPEPVDVIEIGTFLGVGSAVLASYCKSVFTFDIFYRNSNHIWDVLEVDDRINCFTGDQQFIDDVVGELRNSTGYNFNFAFVDGMHKVENVRHDFELVKFCGRVLFHDAHIPEIGEFITEIGGIFIDSKEHTGWGFWENG